MASFPVLRTVQDAGRKMAMGLSHEQHAAGQREQAKRQERAVSLAARLSAALKKYWLPVMATIRTIQAVA
jgi:hypothetical protein